MLLSGSNVAGGTAAGQQHCRRTTYAHMRPSRRCAVKVTSANDGWQSNGNGNGSHYGNGNGNGSYYPPPYQQQQQQPSFTIPFLPSMPRMPQPALAVDGTFKASGKTVVITGGSQGIGRATALVFARKGYNVVVAARDPTKLQYVAQDVAQAAGRQGASLAVPTDVTSEREVKDLVNATLAKFESVDVVINCAGIMARGAFLDTPMAEAKRLIDVNYLGAYAVTQNFLPILANSAKKRVWLDRPSVVMVNSFAGKVPTKYMSAFTASKFALAGLTEAIRLELEPMGVHVSQVHPGFVKSNVLEHTEFYGSNSTDDRRSFRQVLRSLPISQSPQEVADAIFNAVASKQGDVTVGIPFMAAEAAFRVTGLNPTAIPFT